MQFGVWTMPSSYALARAKTLRREPSRLYTLPEIARFSGLSSALPFSPLVFAKGQKTGSPNLTPSTREFPLRALKLFKSAASAIPPHRHCTNIAPIACPQGIERIAPIVKRTEREFSRRDANYSSSSNCLSCESERRIRREMCICETFIWRAISACEWPSKKLNSKTRRSCSGNFSSADCNAACSS